ncbi:MAG: MCE family protein [Nitrospirae bacterium]|nr:MCE family protein [Nitrospirota bacterium]
MKNLSPELKVGVFAIIVVLILSYMTFKVGSLPFTWDKGYRLYANFDDIKGLDEKSRIKIAGVDSGTVEKIILKDGKAELTLLIEPDVKVYSDAEATLRMSGLLGDKYLALSQGTSQNSLLKDGDKINNVMPSTDIDELTNELKSAASDIGDMAEIFKDIFGDTERKSLAETINNLEAATSGLEHIIHEERVPLHNTLRDLEKFSKALGDKGPGLIDNLSRLSKALGDKGPTLADDLGKAANELSALIEENRNTIKEGMENIRSAAKSADSIARKIDAGEGTLGKLLANEKLYDSLSKVAEGAGKTLDAVERLRMFMDLRTEFNFKDSKGKESFNLTLQPNRDRYYLLGVVNDPKGSVETINTTLNGVDSYEEKVENKFEFNAQFARRFKDLVLRIGMIESTFGMGADYLFPYDRGMVSLNLWDFNAEEVDTTTAHAKIGVDYNLFKHLFISGGIDNFLNEDRRGLYIGGGLKY